MNHKSKRKVDKNLLGKIRLLACLICGLENSTQVHHVTSRGAGGEDLENNLVPLCVRHHYEIHKIGVKTFFDKYEIMKKWASEHGRDDLL